MSNYTKATDFASKDDLLVGNPSKIVRGAELDAEFNAIQTAVNSKAEAANASLTGVPTAPTAAAGTNTTQIATTAFVLANAPSSSIPAGSVMLFVQTAAPTGWTKSTVHDNKALRVVSGTASSGGSIGFTTAFGTPSVSGSVSLSGTVGSTTLTTTQMPSHTHDVQRYTDGSGTSTPASTIGTSTLSSLNPSTTSAGGNGSHDHSFSGSGSLSSATATINVQYVDVIICTKD